jgi:glycosyl transferase family 2
MEPMAASSSRDLRRSVLNRWLHSATRQRLSDWREERRRTAWPHRRDRRPGEAANVAIVVVNWNTRLLIAQLLFSVFRILGSDHVRQIVVVDNGSTDGSCELLFALRDAGLIHLIANRGQRYHGPALNQGLSWLARRQRAVACSDQIDYVWVLDSDVVILRRDALGRAVDCLESERAAAAGQTTWTPSHENGMLGLYSILLDPVVAWKPPIPPFREEGEPSAALQLSLARAGLPLALFPFADGGYIVHVGRGTLANVATRAPGGNRYLEWALDHNNPHFTEAPGGRSAYNAFLELFSASLPSITPDSLVDSCRTGQLLTVPLAVSEPDAKPSLPSP